MGLFTKSADDLRAELSRAESAHGAALAAWTEDETAPRWKLVEDAERTVKQLRARLARAERTEADARAAKAEAERAQVEAELDALVAENDDQAFVAFMGEIAAEACPIEDAAAKLYERALERLERARQATFRVEELARRLGKPTPTLASWSESMVVATAGTAIWDQHKKQGRPHRVAERELDLLRARRG